MSPTDAETAVVESLTERIAREEILPRIDATLVAEHRENPSGPHGDDLQRVLAFLGRRPAAGASVIVMDPPHGEWAIARLPERRGGRVELTDERFETQRAAQHAVFVRRLDAFLDRYADGDRPDVDLDPDLDAAGRSDGRDAGADTDTGTDDETGGGVDRDGNGGADG